MPTVKRKRKSNWYIYIITFFVTLALLSFTVWSLWDYIRPQSRQASNMGSVNYVPSASDELNVLFMLGSDTNHVPEYYMLIHYKPHQGEIWCIPFRANTKVVSGGTETTLAETYNRYGALSTAEAVGSLIGKTVKKYVYLSEQAFTGFMDLTGSIYLNIPYTITDDTFTIEAGSQLLSGKDTYQYISYKDHPNGEIYQYTVQAQVVTAIINQNMMGLTASTMQKYFSYLSENTITNFSFQDYTKHQQAFAYTTQNSRSPASYYIPNGEITPSGIFEVDAKSLSATFE
jgi:anionic cell wall polymer biosynthesis LytR-Cps2A-Psr (LCP) family protein